MAAERLLERCALFSGGSVYLARPTIGPERESS